MLAETALVKAMWALGNSEFLPQAQALMLENVSGEMTSRRFPG